MIKAKKPVIKVRPKYGVGFAIVAGAIAIMIYWPSASNPDAEQDTASMAATSITNESPPPAALAASISKRTRETVHLLLDSRPGRLSGEALRRRIAELRSNRNDALAIARELLASSDETERLLGARLFLEVGGDPDEAIRRLQGSSSAWAMSETAGWFYVRQDFDRFARAMARIANEIGPSHFDEILRLNTQQGLLQDISPAMHELGVGAFRERFISRLVDADPEFANHVKLALADYSKSTPFRKLLLQGLGDFPPSNFDQLLLPVIRDPSAPENYRWYVIDTYQANASTPGQALVIERAASTSGDPLADKLRTASAAIPLNPAQWATSAIAMEQEFLSILAEAEPDPLRFLRAVAVYSQMLGRTDPTARFNDARQRISDLAKQYRDHYPSELILSDLFNKLRNSQ